MKEDERRQALADALRGVLDHQKSESDAGARPANAGPRATRQLLFVLLLLSWAFIAWIWIARPAFLFGERQDAVSAEVRDASLRFGLYLQRIRIDRYAAEFGRLPNTLDDLAEPREEGVVYVPQGEDYILIGRDDSLELQLSGRMSADSFLGGSLNVLQGARPPGSQ